jgi:hypothetical protein
MSITGMTRRISGRVKWDWRMNKKVNMRKIATWLVAIMMTVILALMFWYSVIGMMPSP